MTTRVKSVKIVAKIYPPQILWDTPATKEEIENFSKFIKTVEDAAAKYIYKGRGSFKIKEKRETVE